MARIFLLVFSLFFFVSTYSQSEIYELRVYEMDFFKPEKVLHDHFQNALIPALNRQGVKHVGVFEELGQALPKKIYLLITYDDIQAFSGVEAALLKDVAFAEAADSYLNAPPEEIPFKRVSSSLIRASTEFTNLVKPSEDAGVLELRIYEAYNEDALRRKVKMFNDHEFQIFEDAGLPMVFFGANISGDQMPCLTYLLAFKDMEAHKEAWSKFGPHPEWKRIIKLEEYANTVSSITRIFLKPLDYSQF
ncbi:NIPSNAP family protein [Lutimonas halocynthiae]|uniref:NIPSNAP family protein n=1 Tax=Lutimonas halocynthiae TaxID=1446477 RepID=UPI0025B4B570|nr:NIPSNAP family protein [Lutimonas halocynthiae]MDN3642874.1 NIPSNAP family protein [Lutimonas halocynthiae]